jgi:alcohol dehydrogenase
MLAVAMGAGRVVAVGRKQAALESLRDTFGPRVIPVAASGDAAKDLAAIRHAAGGGADVALDLLGSANSTSTTLSSLRALKRGGRLVIMGSADVPPLELSFREILANDWEVVGQFMYARTAPGQLAALAAAGLIDLGKIVVTTFKLADFPQAVEAAALMQGLDLTAVVP